MQIAVIVIGTLAAGLCHKTWAGMGVTMPFQTAMLYRYGVMGFSIPIIWAACALALRNRRDVSDDAKNLVFWLGIFVLIGLIVFVIYADVLTWPGMGYRFVDGNDD